MLFRIGNLVVSIKREPKPEDVGRQVVTAIKAYEHRGCRNLRSQPPTEAEG